jgi:coenzyme F420-reducing hydrogenase alpha subunit
VSDAILSNHWARMIEVVHCIEKIRELLNDPDLQGTDLVARGERRGEGSASSRRRAARSSTITRSMRTTRSPIAT